MQPDRAHSTSVDELPLAGTSTGEIPSGLRLLCAGPREPSWVSLTLQLDAVGCVEPRFRWASTANESLTILRNESFDCILMSDWRSLDSRSRPQQFDLMSMLRGIRASGCDDPVIMMTTRLDDTSWSNACQLQCEIMITPSPWESIALVPVIRQSIARVELIRENHRLAINEHRRLVRERDEADHLLVQQRKIIAELEEMAEPQGNSANTTEAMASQSNVGVAQKPTVPLPPQIDEYYHELLRTYVIMGSGNLGKEIAKLAELIALAELSPRQALHLHLERVESLVRGLGNRSTRHVMARADLLALELMVHLGECYQKNQQ